MPDRDFVEAAKRLLLDRKRELEATITADLSELQGTEGHHLADMEDLGSDAFDEGTAFHLLELESANLKQIKLALDLIERGEYGRCEECSKPIGEERLTALPFASLCIECKRVQELG